MHANVLKKFGKNPAYVQYEAWPSAVLRPHQVRVAVLAAGLNPVDIKTIEGEPKMLLPFKPPFVLGVDMVGQVLEVGSCVEGVQPGARVLAYSGMSQMSMFADEVVLDAQNLTGAPSSMSDVECASLPLPALCALEALDAAEVGKNHRVLIHGGAGGVGSMALQMARSRGAHVTVTASKADEAWLLQQGVSRVIDYRSERFHEVVKDVDFVLDTVGAEVLWNSFSVLKKQGVLASLHIPPPVEVIQNAGLRANGVLRLLLPLMTRKYYKRAEAFNVRLVPVMTVPNQTRLKEVVRMADAGILIPRVDKVFELSELPRAVEYFLSGQARGRVVLRSSGTTRLHA